MSQKTPVTLNSKFGTAMKFERLLRELDLLDDQRVNRVRFFRESFVENTTQKSQVFNNFLTLLSGYDSCNNNEMRNKRETLMSTGYQLILANDVPFMTIINDLHDEAYL